MATATLSENGHITIPKNIRDKPRLKPGETLRISVQNDEIRLKTNTTRSTVSLMSLAGSIKTDRKFTTEEIDQAIETALGSCERCFC